MMSPTQILIWIMKNHIQKGAKEEKLQAEYVSITTSAFVRFFNNNPLLGAQ